MPTRRRRLARLTDELDEGQAAWLLAEDLPDECSVPAFNRWCWLQRDDPGADLPDRSPNARELWSSFGRDAIELWHARHGDTPHPLVAYLGLPP
jgi:hypothetical protein